MHTEDRGGSHDLMLEILESGPVLNADAPDGPSGRLVKSLRDDPAGIAEDCSSVVLFLHLQAV